ncbi:MAG: VCBS repeat-containing protein, partial [Phycisphaerae bacterium]
MIRFAVSIVFVPFLVGAGGQAEAMSQPDRPLLIPPQLADRPQPDSRRGVAGVPRLPFDSDAAKGALTGTHASIPPPEDPSAYLFPGPIIGSVGGEWAVTADFNDDGWTDVAGARRNDCTVHVLHGAPDGTFDGPDEYSIEASCGIGGDYPKSLAVGHFDDDALEDLVVLLLNRVVLLFGQADGTFVVDDVSYPMGGTTVLTGDFDADGFSDVVTSGVALRRGQGDRTLGPLTSLEFTGDYPSAVFVADQNADGVDDLFGLVRVGSYWNHYWGWVSYGQEGMGLGEPTMLPVPRSAKLLTVGDFNGDGRGDVAIVGYYYHYEGCGDNCDWLTIFYGQSDGTLGDASTYDAWTEFHPIWLSESAGANFMGAGDLDGDGRDDLVVEYFWSRPYSSLNTSSALMVLYGPDGRKWKPWRTTWRPGGTYFGGFTFADLDQDKRAELLSFGGVILDYRTSQGRLATRSDIWPGLTRSRWSLRGVTTADLDGDGALDLAVADEEEWEVRILWGDGTGEFDIDPTTYPTFGRPVNLEAADLNGDDLPDLVVALTAAHN